MTDVDPSDTTTIVLTEPQTPAAIAALQIGRKYYSAALFNHCLRSYHWAVLYATRHGITFDDEILYVAALLHDIGLVHEFDNYDLSFERSGANLAWVFGAAAGWPQSRRAHVGQVIIAHMGTDIVAIDVDAESHLLNIATALDIPGARIDDWPDSERAAVLRQFPRIHISTEILDCFRDQASRKPNSFPAHALRSEAAARVQANPLDEI